MNKKEQPAVILGETDISSPKINVNILHEGNIYIYDATDIVLSFGNKELPAVSDQVLKLETASLKHKVRLGDYVTTGISLISSVGADTLDDRYRGFSILATLIIDILGIETILDSKLELLTVLRLAKAPIDGLIVVENADRYDVLVAKASDKAIEEYCNDINSSVFVNTLFVKVLSSDITHFNAMVFSKQLCLIGPMLFRIQKDGNIGYIHLDEDMLDGTVGVADSRIGAIFRFGYLSKGKVKFYYSNVLNNTFTHAYSRIPYDVVKKLAYIANSKGVAKKYICNQVKLKKLYNK